ncbi:eukaryotic translation initiation factor 3 subunit A-like [Anopheles bellator]|uniref:eukaryotic translation initiation factor 3 subunit A-like n=1 Tax=Anopheles bellator TaxID=139047 RepID=UPI0026492C2B|nr:eukaryotic translation initiation factor 3 subunit A-like [Anopheles bellator]
MNGFFQLNATYYNEFKQEVGTGAYAGAPTQQTQQQHQQQSSTVAGSGQIDPLSAEALTKNQRRFLKETEESRARRLAKNAERMRQKRAAETEEQSRKRMAENAARMRRKRAAESEEDYRQRMERYAAFKMTEDYQRRLAENAERNRRRRQNESEMERSIRRARSAARERLRRAMETPEQRAVRLAKLAERMRITRERLWHTIETPEQRAVRLAKLAERMRVARANETPEQRAVRLAKNAARARQRFLNESPEQWIARKRKKAEYARQKRAAAGDIAHGSQGTSSHLHTSQHNGNLSQQQPTTSLDPTNFNVGQTPTTLPETLLHPGVSHSTNLPMPSATSYVMNLKDNHKLTVSPAKQAHGTELHSDAVYSTPTGQIHHIFTGADIKNGQQLVMQTDPSCPNSLYKFHILPHPFTNAAMASDVQHTTSDQQHTYKSK